VDKEAAKRRITVNEHLSGMNKTFWILNWFFNLFIDNWNEQDENKFYDDSEPYASIDKIAQNTNEPLLEEPWFVHSAHERVERLQSNAELNSIERKKRRNDILFIGKFL
jgi:hypothetical protein